jgi:hypothetical protein
VSAVKYELGFYIPEDGIPHSHRRENLKPYKPYKYISCYETTDFLHSVVMRIRLYLKTIVWKTAMDPSPLLASIACRRATSCPPPLIVASLSLSFRIVSTAPHWVQNGHFTKPVLPVKRGPDTTRNISQV